MRVVVLGATGLLGQHVAAALRRGGHDVVAVSRSGRTLPEEPADAAPAGALTPVRLDVEAVDDAALDALLDGASAAVHCLGPDDRSPLARPVARTLDVRLVGTTVRVAAAAGRRGLDALVVLGSFFSTFDRLHPQWGLSRHPYIAARRAQADRSRDAAGTTAVSVLEIPFVFGAARGTEPVLKATYFDRLRSGPVGIAPGGGAAAVTASDVADAALAVLEGRVPPGRHPLAVDNLTYRHLSRVALDELGRRVPVVVVPPALVTAGAGALALGMRLRGTGTGLAARHVARDLLARDLFLDPAEHAVPLGLVPRSLDDAIRATVRAAYPDLVPATRS